MVSSISFYGSESTGSIGKKTQAQTQTQTQVPPTVTSIPDEGKDTVCFRGYENEEKKSSSILSKLAGFAIAAAVIVGGLGYAHKTDLIGKMKDGKIKDFLKKTDSITEPCHKLCSKVKGYANKGYEKVKAWFD